MKRRALVFAVILVGLAAGAAWFVRSRFESRPTPDVPEIPVDHLHPLVADAVREARGRVESEPQSAEAWGELGMLLLAHDLRSEARTCLTQAAELEPRDFRWPYFLGYSLEGRDFGGALAHYERALQLRFEYVPLRLRMAQILMRLGKLDRCRSILDESRQAEPDNPHVLVLRGRLAVLQNDDRLAEELLTKAATLPKWPAQSAYLELVKLAGRRGNYTRAYEIQRTLASLPAVAKAEVPDPVMEGIRRYEALSKNLAEQADFALARGNLPAAIAGYKSFLEKRKDLPTAYTNLAQAYALSGRYPEAIATYQDVLKRFGDDIAAHLGLAGTYERARQPELAIKHYRAVLRVKPNHQRAWFLLGMLFESRGAHDEAIRCYERSASADPSFAQAHLAWGVALLNQHRDKQARPHIARAVELAPGDPVPQGYLRTVDERLSKAKPGPGR